MEFWTYFKFYVGLFSDGPAATRLSERMCIAKHDFWTTEADDIYGTIQYKKSS